MSDSPPRSIGGRKQTNRGRRRPQGLRRPHFFLELLFRFLARGEVGDWRGRGGDASRTRKSAAAHGARRRPCFALLGAMVIIVCGFRVERAAHGAVCSPATPQAGGERWHIWANPPMTVRPRQGPP